jgi:predicted  nucleic acid-binding Zn-ribbon protein
MDELAEVRDTREENRQALRERIRTVRDENKLLALERIEDMLNRINQRRTDHFLRVIERLRSILARITTRTDRAKQAGKDVTGAEALIAQATASIDSAEQAVQTQKAKVYELNVTDETTARDEVSATVNSLHEDLRAVRDLVNDARQAVFNALQELVGVVKEPALPEPSTEGATQ